MENENVLNANRSIVAQTYEQFSMELEAFIGRRISDSAEVENLVQDVWVKALSYSQPLNADTLKSFLFTVARNLVNDYLRHYYIANGVHEEIKNNASLYADDLDSAIVAADIASHEKQFVEFMPNQRRIIYCMTRYEDMAIDDIAAQLNLSNRTVENHLRLGRKDVRAYINAIA